MIFDQGGRCPLESFCIAVYSDVLYLVLADTAVIASSAAPSISLTISKKKEFFSVTSTRLDWPPARGRLVQFQRHQATPAAHQGALAAAQLGQRATDELRGRCRMQHSVAQHKALALQRGGPPPSVAVRSRHT
jgi:hypothetical protein